MSQQEVGINTCLQYVKLLLLYCVYEYKLELIKEGG